MHKLTSIEHGAAASVALLITLAVVWSFASLGYPSPAHAASASTMHCRSG
jgi:hypothetical protein